MESLGRTCIDPLLLLVTTIIIFHRILCLEKIITERKRKRKARVHHEKQKLS